MMNNRDKGGSVSGRWAWKQEPELQSLDPFKRPWVSGRRPWQFKDRPKFRIGVDLAHPKGDKTVFYGKHADLLIFDDFGTPSYDAKLPDGTLIEYKTCLRRKWWDLDFAEAEKRILAYYDEECKKQFNDACDRAYLSMESKGRLQNSRRMIP